MNRQVIDLGFMLRQIPDFEFTMDDFDGRLKLQKTVYLLQAFNVYVGYDFSWYLRGPYCTLLAKNAFELREIYDEIPKSIAEFKNPDSQKRFEKLLDFLNGKDSDDLEMAASIHFLKRMGGSSDGVIKEQTAKKQPHFTRERVEEIWKEMGKWNLV